MINYDGLTYNLDSIIQFQALKQLLEVLTKKQLVHNLLLYGKNSYFMVKNNDNNININENIQNNQNNINENIINIENENKNYIEKINDSGLINEFINSQKELITQKRIINDLINRIEILERKTDNKRNSIIQINKNYNIRKSLKNSINNINNEKKSSSILDNIKNDNKNISDNKDNYNDDSENKKLENSENEIIKTDDLNEENLIKKIKDFENNFKIINEQIEIIKKDIEKNKKIMDISKNEIMQFKATIQNNLNNLNNLNNIEKEKNKKNKIEENNKNEENKSEEKNNNLEIFEKKMIKIVDSKFKDFLNSKGNILKETFKEKIKEENEKILSEIKNIVNKNIEIENKIKELPNNSVIKRIEEKIKLLDLELDNYLTQNDILKIFNKLDNYEKELNKSKLFIISQNEINAKNKEELFKLKKTFDNVKKTFSSISKIFENNSLSQILEDLNNVSENMVVKEEYIQFVKETNKKISNLKVDVNDHYRILDQIMPLIKKALTVEDLNKLETSLTELIEIKNADAQGIFAKKKEILKSIKLIEAKIKLYIKNLEEEKEKEKNDGVILASKPVGGYKCASCEAYIGELKETESYLPWNKYHLSEKPYNYGNRFSRILQGLNIESTYNPFIDKKKNFSKNNLSIKKYKKFPPLLHVVSEHNMIKNQLIDETFGINNTNTYKKYKDQIKLLRLGNLKNLNDDVIFTNKYIKSNNSFIKTIKNVNKEIK